MDGNLFRLFALFLSLISLGLLFYLRDKRHVSGILIVVLSLVLLLYKSGETIYFAQEGKSVIPYEVSHLAYWVVPFLFLVGLPGSDYAGGALAFVCGVGFLLGAFIRPADLIANMTLYEDIRLLFTHELFFFLSLLSLFTYRSFLGKDYWSFVMTMFFFLLYFLLLRYRVIFPKEDFSSYSIALRVMDGSLVNYLIPDASLTWRILFASFCIGLIFLVPWLLLLLNQARFRQEIKKGKVKESDVPLEHRYGLIPWLQRKKCESKIIPFSR